MSYSVEFEPEAIEALQRLTRAVRIRIVNKIEWLAENFDQIKPLPLKGELAGFFKLRVGDYRVIYEFDTQSKIITIDKIGHRREVYEDSL